MDTPDHITQEDCSPKIRTREQQKDFFLQQACEMMESWKDFRNYDNPMDFFEEDTEMMLRLFHELGGVHTQDIRQMQIACEFYISHAGCTLQEKMKTMKELNRLTLFMMEIINFSDFISRKQYYYERLTDEITQMVES